MATKENKNFARLCRLIVDLGSQALRDTFDRIHPPAKLHTILAAARPTLLSLKKKKILNPMQWGKLYPAVPSKVSSANFDNTLLMVLLRNICSLSPPVGTRSWDKLPRPGDNSTAANIAKIKYYRNEVYAHALQASVDDATFNRLWQDISNALLALGSATTYASAISQLKTECMDADSEKHYRELLKQWKKDDDNIKEMLTNLTEMLKSEVREVKRLKSDVGEVKEMLKSEVGEVKRLKPGDSGTAALAKAKGKNSTLTQLFLSHNKIGDSGAVSLATAMGTNSTLTRLALSHNKIGDPGAIKLARAMEANSSLTKLDVSRNEIGDSGATALARSMATNSTLTKLNLSRNEIGDLGAAALAEAMTTNSKLTHLDLSRNEIGDVGAVALAKAMGKNSTLTELYLSHNEIGDSGAAALVKAVDRIG